MTKLLLAALLVSACADSTLPAGAVCKATADCDTGLTCLDVAQFAGTTCTVVGKACSKTCLDDTGCTDLGANFRCFATCTAEKACEMVAGP